MVDTTYVGYFSPQSDEDKKPLYFPSKEFYEAGKFKNKQLPEFEKNEETVAVSK